MTATTQGRDPSIDVLRGLAIVTMIAANMAPYSLRAPHPFALRVYGSFAAPTFVFLSGTMVGVRARPLSEALRRGAELVLAGAAIDVVCWHLRPFTSMDVLYLIGLSLPVAALATRVSARAHVLVAVAILAVTPALRDWLGYGPLLAEPEPWPFHRRLLVDGWFPVFPWLGVCLLGAAYGRARHSVSRTAELGGGAVLVAVGLVGLVLRPLPFLTRAGYSELFYPPTLRYLCVALGGLALLHAALREFSDGPGAAFLRALGGASLLVYAAHSAVIAFVLERLGPRALPEFLLLYVGHTALLWAIAKGRTALRTARTRPTTPA